MDITNGNAGNVVDFSTLMLKAFLVGNPGLNTDSMMKGKYEYKYLSLSQLLIHSIFYFKSFKKKYIFYLRFCFQSLIR